MAVSALGRLATEVASRRSRAYALIAVAAALPRIAVLLEQRGSILQPFTLGEKSDDIARTFLATGTFGFIPGHPSAYTQPLYSFFLIPLYWVFDRSWAVVGFAQVIVAVATALIVYEIGQRRLVTWSGLAAGLIVALHPYSLWHDVHVNREILDGVLAAAILLLALLLLERRSLLYAAALGAVFGLSILGNVRLALLPLALGTFFLVSWRVGRTSLLLVGTMLAVCAIVLSPWVIRNKIEVGCFALTTDSRALWEANNELTLRVLQHGKWIDNVPVPKSFPPSAQDAGRTYRRHGRIESVDECAQVAFYQHKVLRFWRDHPGEKGRLAAQASLMLWNPVVSPPPTRSDAAGWLTDLRDSVEPVFMGIVFVLGAYGLLRVPSQFAALAVILLAYQWLLAAIFVGATRYRVPWDFVAALLAGAALVDLTRRLDARRARTTS